MHTTAFVTAAVAAATLGAGGLTAAQTHQSITRTFVAVDESGNYALDDIGPGSAADQMDIGDVLALTQTLTRGGHSVGQIHVAGIGVDHTRNLTQSTGTLALADGSVDFAGLVPQTSHFVLPVTAGTGRYAGYEGSVTLDFGDQTHITMRLGK